MTSPRVGLQVLFESPGTDYLPCAAVITAVNVDGTVVLTVFPPGKAPQGAGPAQFYPNRQALIAASLLATGCYEFQPIDITGINP